MDPNTGDSTITDTGALSASSGLRTGRSPKDKRVVLDDVTKDVTLSEKLNQLIGHLVGRCQHSNFTLRIRQKQGKSG